MDNVHVPNVHTVYNVHVHPVYMYMYMQITNRGIQGRQLISKKKLNCREWDSNPQFLAFTIGALTQ